MTATQILVVEDERLVATAIQNELEQFGYEVSGIASTSAEALQKAGEHKPDLVIMDIHLKGDTDGVETARKIRDRFGVPVVYLSAFSDPETVSRASTTEAFGYLLKPYEERELQTTIEMAIAKHRAEQQLQETARARKFEAVSRLAGGLAEPLNSLLTAILANTSLALTDIPDNAENKTLLQRVEVAAQSAAELVQRLTLLSSLSGRSAAQLQQYDLNVLIPKCLNEIISRLNPDILVRYRPGVNLWSVTADELLFGQALLELALHVQEDMPGGGPLGLEAENIALSPDDLAIHPAGHAGDFVRIRICQADRGTPPTIYTHDPQPSYFASAPGRAVGLGLALVSAVVEQQHGWIESTSSDRGKHFEMYWPATR